MGRNGQVHRGDADGTAQVLAVLHRVGQAVGVAQEFLGPLHIPLAKKAADVGGAHLDPIDLHQGDDVAGDAELRTLLLQLDGVPLALVAEVEVLPADQVAGVQVAIEHVRDEIFPGHVHHGLVEMGEDHVLDAVEPVDQICPVLGGVDELHGRVGVQVAGVTVKGEHGGGEPLFRRAVDGFLQEHAVAAVDAVEKVQGEGALGRSCLFQICSPALKR